MPCDWCDDTRWLLLEHEPGVGFVYAPCPKCCWPHRAQAPIPAPVDALAFVSNSKRSALGEDHDWQMHGPAW